MVDFGFQRDSFKLRTLVSNTSDWLNGGEESRFSAFTGNASLTSAYAQDTWRFADAWRATLGEEAFTAAWEAGWAMTVDQAVADALAEGA